MNDGKDQSVETKRTLIDEGTKIKGLLESACPIVVMGRVEGELVGPSLEVTESGIVSGKARVKDLVSRGDLAGEFDAETVELSGHVRDKTVVRARSLEVSLQRGDGPMMMVFGDCELAIGDPPDKAAAIRNVAGARAAATAPAPAGAPAVAAGEGAKAAAPAGDAAGVPVAEMDPGQSGKNGRRNRAKDVAASEV
jgi:cytoskeletal protein CcmA (bactofilin family)